MHFFPCGQGSVCVRVYYGIVLISARCQLDDVSVCCGIGVGLVQGCDCHWWIFGEAPYSTLLSDGIIRFLQTHTQAHGPSRCLGIPTGLTSSDVTSLCLASGWGSVLSSLAVSNRTCPHWFYRSSALITFKCHYS